MNLHYEIIIEIVNEQFPEIMHTKECKEYLKLIEGSEELPYVYFPVFWILLKQTLIKNNSELRNRIFIFIEEMVKSDDKDVANLGAIEMLEPIFGLPYEIYQDVVQNYLLPQSKYIHKNQRQYFYEPVITKENNNGR